MSIDALLSDPRHRPPGGWSALAEADYEASHADPRRLSAQVGRLRRDLDQERQEVADLAAELHARAGRCPEIGPGGAGRPQSGAGRGHGGEHG